MSFPQTTVNVADAVPPRRMPTDTSQGFIAGRVAKGPITTFIECNSMTDYQEKCGMRDATFAAMYDAADLFYRIGGTKLYVGRVVGTTPVKATANIYDQSGSSSPGDVAMTATAKHYGEWYNDIDVVIVYGSGSFQIDVVLDGSPDETLETSPTFATCAEAVSWFTLNSDYVVLALGASNEDPRSQTASLAGGDDDDATIGEAHYLTALNLFIPSLGPGQVALPGRTTDTSLQHLFEHAEDNNRFACGNGEDTATAATVTATAAAVSALGDTSRYGQLAASWIVTNGLTVGSTRTISPDAALMGLYARNDQAGRSPNEPAANELGIVDYANSVTYEYSDANLTDLHEAGVTVFRPVYEQVRAMGFRTLTDPDADPAWLQAANVRMTMFLRAQGQVIGDKYLLMMMDGRRIRLNRFGGELRDMLKQAWLTGALYSDEDDPNNPDTAYTVDVANCNTSETLAARELNAQLAVRLAPGAEMVNIDIVRVAITEAVA